MPFRWQLFAGGKRRERPWDKVDVVCHLASQLGYRHFLEISTKTTGLKFSRLHAAGFETTLRLSYNCPDDFEDGSPIHYRVPDNDISDTIDLLVKEERKFDIILVDPDHEYGNSRRDIEAACRLIHTDGAIVVHDCDPPTREVAAPQFTSGAWCGVTYKAFVDFALANPEVEYRTVDTDFGCGIIMMTAGSARRVLPRSAMPSPRDVARWKALGDDYDAAFDLVSRRKRRILRLVTVDALERAPAGWRQ